MGIPTCDNRISKRDMIEEVRRVHGGNFDESRKPFKHPSQRNTLHYWLKNGDKVIRYHHTDVCILHADGTTATLNSANYRGPTTKNRINEALNSAGMRGGVFQKEGEWYYQNASGNSFPFQDGMKVGVQI